MVFDCFGARKKVVISMAHIGALPGSPLYDADGGVQKLIDGVMSDVEKLQAGGVDAIMFGNENDRLYVSQGLAGRHRGHDGYRAGDQAVAESTVRRQLPVGSAGQRRYRGRHRRKLRTRDLHGPVRLRHGTVAAGLRRRRAPCAPLSAART